MLRTSHRRRARKRLLRPGQMTIDLSGRGDRAGTVTFGSVSVTVGAVSSGEIARNVALGQAALARAQHTLTQPGVTIPVAEGVALYEADPERPDRLVRTLDGRRERGVFEGGKFKVTT